MFAGVYLNLYKNLCVFLFAIQTVTLYHINSKNFFSNIDYFTFTLGFFGDQVCLIFLYKYVKYFAM